MTQSNEGQLDTAIFEGSEARSLLNHPILLKALDDLEAKASAEMVDALNAEEREAKWYMTRAIKELKKQLLRTANAGAVAQETKAKRVRNVKREG